MWGLFSRRNKNQEAAVEAETVSELKYYAVNRSVGTMELRTVGVYVGNAPDGAVIMRLPSFEDEYVYRPATEVEGPFDSINTVIELLSQDNPPVVEQPEVEEVPEAFATEEAEKFYYAQRLARKIVAANCPGFEWVGELSHSHINNMSSHIGNYAKREERAGRVVRTRKDKSAYNYEIEFFKRAALQWRDHATLKLGYVAGSK